jgi:hypothetical protein
VLDELVGACHREVAVLLGDFDQRREQRAAVGVHLGDRFVVLTGACQLDDVQGHGGVAL